MFCSSCGTQANEGASFCASCGRPIAAPTATVSDPTHQAGSLPKENIVSVFRSPTSALHAAKKRTWAFSSGLVFIGIGFVNLLVGSADKGFNWAIGIIGLIVGISLIGQGVLLLGYQENK
jgi:hypothetical protein